MHCKKPLSNICTWLQLQDFLTLHSQTHATYFLLDWPQTIMIYSRLKTSLHQSQDSDSMECLLWHFLWFVCKEGNMIEVIVVRVRSSIVQIDFQEKVPTVLWHEVKCETMQWQAYCAWNDKRLQTCLMTTHETIVPTCAHPFVGLCTSNGLLTQQPLVHS